MSDTVTVTLDGEDYEVPYLLTLNPMQAIAYQFDQWAKDNPAPVTAVKAAEGWASKDVRKIGSVVRVTQEMIDDAPPSLDQFMEMARKSQIRRHIANQRELEWQDHEDWDSPAVERGYN